MELSKFAGQLLGVIVVTLIGLYWLGIGTQHLWAMVLTWIAGG